MAPTLAGQHSFGPFNVQWNADLVNEKLTASATVHNIQVASIELDRSNPNGKLGGEAYGFDAEVDLTVDFDNKQINYEGKFKVFGAVVYDHKGHLLTW